MSGETLSTTVNHKDTPAALGLSFQSFVWTGTEAKQCFNGSF